MSSLNQLYPPVTSNPLPTMGTKDLSEYKALLGRITPLPDEPEPREISFTHDWSPLDYYKLGWVSLGSIEVVGFILSTTPYIQYLQTGMSGRREADGPYIRFQVLVPFWAMAWKTEHRYVRERYDCALYSNRFHMSLRLQARFPNYIPEAAVACLAKYRKYAEDT